MCRSKFNAITSERGLMTRVLDKTSGQYIEVHLMATADEIIDGYKVLYYQRCVSGDMDPKYFPRSDTFLNTGAWDEAEDIEHWAVRFDRNPPHDGGRG